jgi:hypothetical protein
MSLSDRERAEGFRGPVRGCIDCTLRDCERTGSYRGPIDVPVE